MSVANRLTDLMVMLFRLIDFRLWARGPAILLLQGRRPTSGRRVPRGFPQVRGGPVGSC